MLVLTRQANQKVVVVVGGETMEIAVVEVRGDKVRLGFKAPKHVDIYREEVYERVRAENVAAARFAREAGGGVVDGGIASR